MKLTSKNTKTELLWATESLNRRIRELESELHVRDDMGDEVLRILREATGKRDFHSEMEAAKHAAKMLAEARLDSARLDWIFNSNTCTSEEVAELINGFIWRGKYRGSGRAAIDAAMTDAEALLADGVKEDEL